MTDRASSPAELRGPRVRLGPLTEQHLDDVRRWRSDPVVTHYWITRAVPTPNELRDWLARNRQPGTLLWLIKEERGHPIGYVSLFEIQPVHRRAELALMIGERSVWSRGYAREALRVVLSHAFTGESEGGLGLHKVWLTVFAENEAARRAYRACGFQEEGRLREDMYRDGTWHDQILMSILDREFAEVERTDPLRRSDGERT